MKLLLTEAEWEQADALWSDAFEVAASRLTYLETRAALAAAGRAHRFDPAHLALARTKLEERWAGILPIELDTLVGEAASRAAETYGLRAGDAVHLASALILEDEELVFATWDGVLRSAAAAAGLAVAP